MSEPERPDEGQLILYQTEAGTVRIEVLYESETFWLNQKKIAELFGVDVRTISEHLHNVFASKELEEQSVLRKFRTTADDGKSYLVNFYNLDALLAFNEYEVLTNAGSVSAEVAKRLAEERYATFRVR